MSSSTPPLSVVVPTYNRAALLERCVRSILESHFREFELIISDDGSTDATERTAEHFRAADPRVVYLKAPNGGPAVARNRGWRRAQAPIVAFIDDDCIAEPTWTGAIVETLAARPELAGVEGHTLPETNQRSFFIHSIDSRAGDYLTCNLALRRKALEAVGGLDEQFPFAACEDIDLCLRVVEQVGPIGYADQVRVRHGMIPTSWKYHLRRIKYDPSYDVLFGRHPRRFTEAIEHLPVVGTFGARLARPEPDQIRLYLAAFRLANGLFAFRDGVSVYERVAGLGILTASALATLLPRPLQRRMLPK